MPIPERCGFPDRLGMGGQQVVFLGFILFTRVPKWKFPFLTHGHFVFARAAGRCELRPLGATGEAGRYRHSALHAAGLDLTSRENPNLCLAFEAHCTLLE